MSTATPTRSNTLTVRLSTDELTMLDRTCDYVRRTGRTVLGEPTITHADALRKLATLGYKKIDAALKRETAAAATQTEAPDSGTARTPEAPGAPDAGSPAGPSFAGIGALERRDADTA